MMNGSCGIAKVGDIMLKDDYLVEPIDKKIAYALVVKYHYLHRKPPCTFAFGLIHKVDQSVVGIVTYGIPPSSTLLRGICGQNNAKNVYELNRLWVDDSVPKNGESFFVSRTFPYLDREIIVSFADTSHNHVGYIYQALNFTYCGLSAKFRDPKVRGLENQHHATYAHGMTNMQLKEKYGNLLYYEERPRKHRYVYFNASKQRKKILMKELRYTVEPYPKIKMTPCQMLMNFSPKIAAPMV